MCCWWCLTRTLVAICLLALPAAVPPRSTATLAAVFSLNRTNGDVCVCKGLAWLDNRALAGCVSIVYGLPDLSLTGRTNSVASLECRHTARVAGC
jgi:hypothetical protein